MEAFFFDFLISVFVGELLFSPGALVEEFTIDLERSELGVGLLIVTRVIRCKQHLLSQFIVVRNSVTIPVLFSTQIAISLV